MMFNSRHCQLKKKQGNLGDEWYLDEVFIKLNGKVHYLWRAVDQDGCELDVFVSKRRNKKTAVKFFRKRISRINTISMHA